MSNKVTIEGLEFELFKEYDKAKLPSLTFEGRVAWFEKRVELVLINPLKVLADDSFRNSIKNKNGNILLCFGTLICGGIEALGGFLKGRASFRGFKSFVKGYMDTGWQVTLSYGLPRWRALRDDFRNGLAHGLTVQKGDLRLRRTTLRKNHTDWKLTKIYSFETLNKLFRDTYLILKIRMNQIQLKRNLRKDSEMYF